MKVLEQTSKISSLISFAYSWTTESGYMKIKLWQGLWLVSLDKCLMQIENRVPSVARQGTLQEALGILQRPENYLTWKGSTLHW